MEQTMRHSLHTASTWTDSRRPSPDMLSIARQLILPFRQVLCNVKQPRSGRQAMTWLRHLRRALLTALTWGVLWAPLGVIVGILWDPNDTMDEPWIALGA